jgi:hypothetical protein
MRPGADNASPSQTVYVKADWREITLIECY